MGIIVNLPQLSKLRDGQWCLVLQQIPGATLDSSAGVYTFANCSLAGKPNITFTFANQSYPLAPSGYVLQQVCLYPSRGNCTLSDILRLQMP